MNAKPIQVETHVVPIDDVIPNEWNPNRMDERTYEAARESIREYGFIDPITVRPHPEQEGKWEVLDGEHRLRGAREEGYTEVQIANVGALDDSAARKLTIIFNETRGEADLTLLGILVAQLNSDIDDATLLRLGLPYSDAEIENLIQIGNTDWDQWLQDSEMKTRDETAAGPEGTVTIFHHLTPEQKEKYDLYVDILCREKDLPDATAAVMFALREVAETA